VEAGTRRKEKKKKRGRKKRNHSYMSRSSVHNKIGFKFLFK
jgi:hypothetical protein